MQLCRYVSSASPHSDRFNRSSLDVAFFTRTTAQLLDDPAAGDELGQPMIATKVPEPSILFGLTLVSLLGVGMQRKATTKAQK